MIKAMEKSSGWRRLINACYFSYKGLRFAILHEAAFRQELVVVSVLLPVSFLCNVSVIERLFMIAVLLNVLIIELLNTAVEAVVDRIGEEHHRLAGVAKDAASAAVLLSILIVIIIWVGILLF